MLRGALLGRALTVGEVSLTSRDNAHQGGPLCLGVWSDHPAFTLCREAADKAGEHTEAALMGSLPMYVPDFKNVVMPAIVHALDEWRNEAEKSESSGRCLMPMPSHAPECIAIAGTPPKQGGN